MPQELVAGERTAPETVELAANIKKAHVTGETPTAENYMDVSIVTWADILQCFINF